MPYITAETVKQKRQAIRKAFPEYKISVRKEHHSSIRVVIQSGPLNLLADNTARGHMPINHFYVKEHYANYPDVRDVLSRIVDIAKEGQRQESYDGDYGSIPSYYVDIHVGEWDKHYVVTK